MRIHIGTHKRHHRLLPRLFLILFTLFTATSAMAGDWAPVGDSGLRHLTRWHLHYLQPELSLLFDRNERGFHCYRYQLIIHRLRRNG